MKGFKYYEAKGNSSDEIYKQKDTICVHYCYCFVDRSGKEEWFVNGKPAQINKCECGATACGYNSHSDWCPLSNKD